MKIHELQVAGSKNRKRVGRGISAGGGKTAGRGTKGQNSRSGGGVRAGFEGGQNPLAKRLPKKRGFVPYRRVEYVEVNLARLEKMPAGTITIEKLVEAGVIKNSKRPVKVLGTGELKKKQNVKLQAATQSAQAAIEKAGGSFEVSPLKRHPKSKIKTETPEQE
jgi:large subunit ribosomal protein L15